MICILSSRQRFYSKRVLMKSKFTRENLHGFEQKRNLRKLKVHVLSAVGNNSIIIHLKLTAINGDMLNAPTLITEIRVNQSHIRLWTIQLKTWVIDDTIILCPIGNNSIKDVRLRIQIHGKLTRVERSCKIISPTTFSMLSNYRRLN